MIQLNQSFTSLGKIKTVAMLKMQSKRLSRHVWQFSFLVLAMLLGCAQAEAQRPKGVRYSTQGCGDFLARWDKKPKTLKFIDCKTYELQQVGVLTSSYMVQGADAIEIEKFLQSEFSMTPLRFLCCYWSPSPAKGEVAPHYGQYIDPEGAKFRVSMFSGETLSNGRNFWHKIPEFRIEITTYLGEF